MGIFWKKRHDDYPESFDDILQKHLGKSEYTQLEISEADDSLKKIYQRNQDDIREISKQLDDYLKWVAGGALIVTSQIFLSDKIQSLDYLPLLISSFIFFGLSILLVLLSYRLGCSSLLCMPKSKVASDKISALIRKKGISIEHESKLNYDIETEYRKFIGEARKGESLGRWTNRFSWLAFIFVVIGLISFIAFGFINFI